MTGLSRLKSPIIWISTAIYIIVGLFDSGLLIDKSLEFRWAYTLTKIILLFAALFIGFKASDGRRGAIIWLTIVLSSFAVLAIVAYSHTH